MFLTEEGRQSGGSRGGSYHSGGSGYGEYDRPSYRRSGSSGWGIGAILFWVRAALVCSIRALAGWAARASFCSLV